MATLFRRPLTLILCLLASKNLLVTTLALPPSVNPTPINLREAALSKTLDSPSKLSPRMDNESPYLCTAEFWSPGNNNPLADGNNPNQNTDVFLYWQVVVPSRAGLEQALQRKIDKRIVLMDPVPSQRRLPGASTFITPKGTTAQRMTDLLSTELGLQRQCQAPSVTTHPEAYCALCTYAVGPPETVSKCNTDTNHIYHKDCLVKATGEQPMDKCGHCESNGVDGKLGYGDVYYDVSTVSGSAPGFDFDD